MTGLVKKVRVENGFTIANVTATVGVLCTGASIKIDVRRNGTATTNSIFTSDTPLEIGTATGAVNGEYTVERDYLFMMGDNRNVSGDSRYWDNMFVSRDKIKGKAIFKYPKFAWLN